MIAVENYFSDNTSELQHILHQQNDSINNLRTGKILFQEYCASCHGIKNKIVAEPFVNIIKRWSISEFAGNNFKSRDSTHAQFFKLLSVEELKDIRHFIYNESLK